MQCIGRLRDADAIRKHVTSALAGIKIAPYYGCLMSRPPELMNFGDPENPSLMESLLAACGADSILDFPLKTECCGASSGIPHRPLTARNSGRILELAVRMGADCVAVCCPLCQMNLDLRQKQAAKAEGTRFNIPVLYYTQLMGIAFGCSADELGLKKLCVSPDRVIDKIRALSTAAKDKAAKGGNA